VRHLRDLVSVGPATLADFELLGIASVAELARCDAADLYARLARLTGQRQDPCVEDVFCAAIAQARDPDLPAEQARWYYWSRRRKARQRAGSG
jgi:nucleotidyltransferase/DNA polymerase involved in DNA repair